MLQKYAATHTVILIAVFSVLSFVDFGIPERSITTDDIESSIGKILFVIGILVVIIPVFINTI